MFIVDADIPVYLHPKLIGKGSGREIFDRCVVDGLGMVDWGMVDRAMVSTKTWSNFFWTFHIWCFLKPPNWGVAEAREAMLRARILKA